jgi:hypothetical protein
MLVINSYSDCAGLQHFKVYVILFTFLFSYITHILEKACQLDESSLSKPYLKLESTFNIQASRTTGVVAELATVRAEAEENSVVVHEEKDGRINVE